MKIVSLSLLAFTLATFPAFAARTQSGSRAALRRAVEREAGDRIDVPNFYLASNQCGGAGACRSSVLHLHARMQNGLICHASALETAYCMPGAVSSEE